MAIPQGFKLAEPTTPEQQAAIDVPAPSNIPTGFRLVSPTEQPQTEQPQADLLGQAQEVLSAVGSNLGELAAGLNRATASIVDTFGIDNANTILRLVGSQTQIPTAVSFLPKKGAIAGEGLGTDIAAGIGETIPSALGIGGALRVLAKGVPALASLAGTALTDIIGGALGGAGEAIGEEAGGDVGGIIGSFVGPILPAILKAPKTAITNILNIARARPTGEQQQIIQAGKDNGLDILTTDVVPPDSFLGKWAQSISEKLGILGIGAARSRQQIARQNIVEEVAKDFNIDINADTTGDIVKSINAVSSRKLEKANLIRNESIDIFDNFGRVPVDKLSTEVNKQLTKQSALGAVAEESITRRLEDILSASRGARDFGVLSQIRTSLIDDILKARSRENFKLERILQPVKSAIDKDMARFANQRGEIGKRAGVQWRAANRDISKELDTIKGTELARIFRGGTANPQKIAPILFSGKPNQLDRLAENTGKKGKEAIRATIVQDILRRSGFLQGNINPDRFATAIKRTEIQRAMNKFFTGSDRKQLEGIGKVLDATRRAQQAALKTETGQQLIPFAAGGTAVAAFRESPLLTLGGAASLSIAAKAYESPAFRGLMIKIANARKDSIVEERLLKQAVPGILAGLRQTAAPQAAIEQQAQ